MSSDLPVPEGLHRVDGDTFHCGWCERAVNWARVVLRDFSLTGGFGMSVDERTGQVVVAVEARLEVTDHAGEMRVLPHYCSEIPADVRDLMLQKGPGEGSADVTTVQRARTVGFVVSAVAAEGGVVMLNRLESLYNTAMLYALMAYSIFAIYVILFHGQTWLAFAVAATWFAREVDEEYAHPGDHA